ncbi:MAG: hypothetical protein D3926_17325 [Desulfobacteraceae bacterium]|nr:MAG: hypothetical protein D3926_17325 [Desulfobacteraceae bacterium]
MRPALVIVSLCFNVLTTPLSWAAPACGHVTMDWIKSHVSLSTGTTMILKQPQGNLCEVILSIGGTLTPIYAGKDFLVAGRLFKQGKPVTQETLAALSDVAEAEKNRATAKKALAVEQRKTFFKNRFRDLEGLFTLTFHTGQPEHFVYVITDPNCTHCKELLDDLEILAVEANLALKVIIYPGLGEQSQNMAAHAICNDLSYGEYRGMSGNEAKTECEKYADILNKTKSFFVSGRITSVPIVVAGDGSWTVEGKEINQVRTHLGIEVPKE